jgi:mRNA interferase MazF
VVIKRGDICWHDLGPIVDRGPAKRRPVVVVQSDNVTRSRIGTILVVSMTSATEKAGIPGNVFVPGTLSGLPKDSVVVVSQLMAIDRDLVSDPIGEVSPTLMRDVDAGLRRVLHL